MTVLDFSTQRPAYLIHQARDSNDSIAITNLNSRSSCHLKHWLQYIDRQPAVAKKLNVTRGWLEIVEMLL